MKDEPAAAGLGLNPFSQRPESDLTRSERGDLLDQVLERTTQAIKSPDDECVAGAEMSDRGGEARAIGGSTACDVREYFLAARARQRVALEFEILING
jgi:hypothetical protein